MEMVSEVTLNLLRSFGAILGSFLGHFRNNPGQFVAPNSKLLQTSHVTTQNDPKRSRIPMEMVSEVNLSMLRSFQDHLGPFEAILELFFGLNLKLLQTSHVTTQNDRKRSRILMEMVSEVNLKILMSFWDHLGPFGIIWDHLEPIGTIWGYFCV